MSRHQFFVAGEPIPQPRPRAAIMGKHVRIYSPAKHPVTKWKRAIMARALQEGLSGKNIDKLTRVEITCHIPRPASHYNRSKKAVRPQLKTLAPIYPTSPRQDVDNLAKSILDALVDAHVLMDDGVIVELTCRKAYSEPESAGASITITENP